MLTFRSLSVCLLIWAAPVAAATIEGPARAIDGDTLEVAGQRVRLFGIDAPERKQRCRESGIDWACGQWATDRLAARIAGRRIRCDGDERDRYDRLLARCTAEGEDLGRWLVRIGAATAYRRYSLLYAEDEAQAVAGRAGVWSGEMESPERVRHPQGSLPPPGECLIKGNVSTRGRIYHMPGQEAYERTVISGPEERWFCTPEEAESAGFRAARR